MITMNSDDEQVRKISKLLELGGTMLAEHCNICGSPMFRYHGNVICPVCNTKEEGQSAQVPAIPSVVSTPEPMPELSQPESQPASQPAPQPVSQGTNAPKNVVSGGAVLPLEELILKKITSIANSMQDETDPRRISEQLDIIERGLGVIEQLRNIA